MGCVALRTLIGGARECLVKSIDFDCRSSWIAIDHFLTGTPHLLLIYQSHYRWSQSYKNNRIESNRQMKKKKIQLSTKSTVERETERESEQKIRVERMTKEWRKWDNWEWQMRSLPFCHGAMSNDVLLMTCSWLALNHQTKNREKRSHQIINS